MDETFRASVPKGLNRQKQVALFAAMLLLLLLSHLPLLQLPYIWDEAGYYVPAARDLLLGNLIPTSSVSNAHPPLVMTWLAMCWKVAGFHIVVTRIAMLAVAAFTLLGVFRLADLVANTEIALASTICTGLYSVFFMQSSLAHLDLAAAGLTLWALHSYLGQRRWATMVWFSLAALAKETAIIAPIALAVWELASRCTPRLRTARGLQPVKNAVPLLVSALPLLLWLGYHYARTGYVLGNPEFFRYNVTATLHPLRILLAGMMRLWQISGYMHLWLLTIAGGLAMFLPPQAEGKRDRPRIPVPVQAIFVVVILAYVVALAAIGGAVLARYMLPVIPLIVLLWVSTLWRRVRYWRAVLAIICASFIAAWFVNPPYGFPFEDNLAYRDYILLHEEAEQSLASLTPTARVLTAWPASDEVSKPYLGYVSHPLRIVQIEDFSLPQIALAAEARSQFDVALVFSTKYEPPRPFFLAKWKVWDQLKQEFFGFHHDLPPGAVAQILGGELAYSRTRNSQWIAVIEVPHAVDAQLTKDPIQPAIK